MEEIEAKLNRNDVDFGDVRGQEFAKRALTVAAAGGHNVIMLGSPGSGTTMLARRVPTILPPLTPEESLETTRIYSAVGKMVPGEALLTTRPFGVRTTRSAGVEKYMGRTSGPLLDRIDWHVEVPAVPFEDLSKPGEGTGSAKMREEVFRAREVQAGRFGRGAGKVNGRMTSKQIRTHGALDAAGQASLKEAMEAFGLSARAHDRILHVSRTVADLAGRDRITQDHVAEAIGFRALDRKLWQG